MPFMRLSKSQRRSLEQEVVPSEARLEFTRLIRDRCSAVTDDPGGVINLIRENEFVNLANTVMGKPIYSLSSDDWGFFEPVEFAWHHGQRELIMRLPSTAELVEILADYIQKGMFPRKTVNRILKHYNCGFSFRDAGDMDGIIIEVVIEYEESIPEPDLSNDHPNVRRLILRMEAALEANDFAAVMHASASVFETLAKDVTQNPSVNNQTLASFFASYRKKSLLPEPVLDYMLDVYKARNIQPLAGHGSLTAPTVTPEQALSLSELTKTIVRMERALAQQKVHLNPTPQAKPAAASAGPAVSEEPFSPATSSP
jgi:hypothetical protein